MHSHIQKMIHFWYFEIVDTSGNRITFPEIDRSNVKDPNWLQISLSNKYQDRYAATIIE